jgi:acetyltransferase-like isoleucine patch superfamily enzyme
VSEHLFFDPATLGSCGRNVIIGRTVRIRYPELVHIGDDCIIDDFTYISTALRLERYVHVAAGAKFIGGRASEIVIGAFSALAPNVVLSAGSDDYHGGIAGPLVPQEFKGNAVYGRIVLGKHCVIGAGSVVSPNVTFGEGAAVGALSLVKVDLAPWTTNAGIPSRVLGMRDREGTLAAEAAFLATRSRRDD